MPHNPSSPRQHVATNDRGTPRPRHLARIPDDQSKSNIGTHEEKIEPDDTKRLAIG